MSLSAQTTQFTFHNELLPEPASLTITDGVFPLETSLTVALTGASSPALEAYTLRTLKRLEDKTGTPLPRTLSATGSITLHVAAAGPAVQTLDEDESYTLTSTPAAMTIEAATPVGAMHALETLYQLAQPAPAANSSQGSAYVIPAVTIHDSPALPLARPHDRLRPTLRAHGRPQAQPRRHGRCQAQRLPLAPHRGPGLPHRVQALPQTHPARLRRPLLHPGRRPRARPLRRRPRHPRRARVRNARSLSAAWLVAYPELSSGTVPTGIRREFGISDIALDPTREETYKFIARFLGEMATLFPDQYLHIGGDETPAPDWKSNPRILAFKQQHNLADNDALQSYFNQRVLKILTGLNKRMVGWDEILNPALPKSIVIQSWRGEASLATAATQGYNGVLSAPYYLDAMKPAGVHYLADPIPADTKLTPDQQKFILGGEVAMWAEQLDQRTIDSRIWPPYRRHRRALLVSTVRPRRRRHVPPPHPRLTRA